MCPVYVNGNAGSGFDPASDQAITGAWSFSQTLGTAAIEATGEVASDANVVAREGVASQVSMGNVGPAAQAGLIFGSLGDVNLFRLDASTLATDDSLNVGGDLLVPGGTIVCDGMSAATSDVLTAKISGDAVNRIVVNGDGRMDWGNGAGAADVSLFRNSVGLLRTDGYLQIDGGLAVNGDAINSSVGSLAFIADALDAVGSVFTRCRIDGDGVPRFVMYADGKFEWGSGAAAADTNLYRLGADQLATDDLFQASNFRVSGAGKFVAIGSAAEVPQLEMRRSGSGTSEIFVYNTGKIEWGSGGAAADTNLFRSAADTLKTDDSFIVGANLQVDGNSVIGSAVTDSVGFYGDTGAVQATAIADAVGGVVIDAEARTALNALLAAMRTTTGVALIAG